MSQKNTNKLQTSSTDNNILKIVTLGDTFVGKTGLIFKFTEGSLGYQGSTIGVDFKLKTINVTGKEVKLEIWDTAGQERYRRAAAAYLNKAHGAILCYAVNNRNSFVEIEKWIEQIKHSPSKDIPMMLVATKKDVDTCKDAFTLPRCVDEIEGKALAAKYRVPFIETSSVDGTNVDEVFETIAKLALEKNEVVVEPQPEIFEENVCCLWGFLCPSKKKKEGIKNQEKFASLILMTSPEKKLDKRIQSYEDRVLK